VHEADDGPRPGSIARGLTLPQDRSLEWVLRLALATSATTCPPRSCTAYRLFRARGRLFPACWFLFVDLEALRWPYELHQRVRTDWPQHLRRRSATTTWTRGGERHHNAETSPTCSSTTPCWQPAGEGGGQDGTSSSTATSSGAVDQGPRPAAVKDLGVEVVFESTGKFTKREDVEKHLAPAPRGSLSPRLPRGRTPRWCRRERRQVRPVEAPHHLQRLLHDECLRRSRRSCRIDSASARAG